MNPITRVIVVLCVLTSAVARAQERREPPKFHSTILGITVVAASDVPREMGLPSLGARKCVLVTEVDKNGPLHGKVFVGAAITTVNGEKTASLSEFQAATQDLAAGTDVTLKGLSVKRGPKPAWASAEMTFQLPAVAVASKPRPDPNVAVSRPENMPTVSGRAGSPLKTELPSQEVQINHKDTVIATSGKKPEASLRPISVDESLALSVEQYARFRIRLPRLTDARIRRIAWSGDSNIVAIATSEHVAAYSVAPLREVFLLPVADGPAELSLSQDGTVMAWLTESGQVSIVSIANGSGPANVASNPNMGRAKLLMWKSEPSQLLLAYQVGYRWISPDGKVIEQQRWPSPVESFDLAAFDKYLRFGCFVGASESPMIEDIVAKTQVAAPLKENGLSIEALAVRDRNSNPSILCGTSIGVAEGSLNKPDDIRMVCGNRGGGSLTYVYGHPALPWICAQSADHGISVQRTDAPTVQPFEKSVLWQSRGDQDGDYGTVGVSPDGTMLATSVGGQTLLLLGITAKYDGSNDPRQRVIATADPLAEVSSGSVSKATAAPEGWNWTVRTGAARACMASLPTPVVVKPASQMRAAFDMSAGTLANTVFSSFGQGEAVLWDCEKSEKANYPISLSNWRINKELETYVEADNGDWPSYMVPSKPATSKEEMVRRQRSPCGTIGKELLDGLKVLSAEGRYLINVSPTVPAIRRKSWLRAWEAKTGVARSLGTGQPDDDLLPVDKPVALRPDSAIRDSVLKGTGVAVSGWDVSPRSQIVAGITRTAVTVWDLETEERRVLPIECQLGGDGIRGQTHFSPDGKYLCVAVQTQTEHGPSGGTHLIVFATESWEQLWERQLDNASANEDAYTYTPNGLFVVRNNKDFLEASSGILHHSLPEESSCIAFCDDGITAAVTYGNGKILLWDYMTGSLIASCEYDDPMSKRSLVCIAKGGRFVVGGNSRIPLDLSVEATDGRWAGIYDVAPAVAEYRQHRKARANTKGTEENPHFCIPTELYNGVVGSGQERKISVGDWAVLTHCRWGNAFPAGILDGREAVGVFLTVPGDEPHGGICFFPEDTYKQFANNAGKHPILCRVHAVRNVSLEAGGVGKQVVMECVDVGERPVQ